MQYNAPDYSQKGIQTFQTQFIQNKGFYQSIAEGRLTMYGAYVGASLAGVIVCGNSYISCCFVKSQYHRQGIGRRLMEQAFADLKAQGKSSVELNASSYAVSFYLTLGFRPTGEQANYKGIIYTPMKLEI